MRRLRMRRWHVAGVALVAVLVQGALVLSARAEPTEPSEPTEDTPIELEGMEPLDLSMPLPALSEDGDDVPTLTEKKTTAPNASASADWDAQAGVAQRAPAIPAAEFRLEQLLAGAVPDQSTGVAWANVRAPGFIWDQTEIGTRVDPAQEEGKLAATLSRSVPVGENLSVTLQHGAAVTRTLANGTLATPASQTWASSQAVRFNILPTDTTVAVDANISSVEDKWLRSLSAEQKLFGGPLSVTGSVSETPAGAPSKSLKAGFKATW